MKNIMKRILHKTPPPATQPTINFLDLLAQRVVYLNPDGTVKADQTLPKKERP